MKKFFNYFLILALLPAFVLTSCKEDEEDTPVVEKGTFVDLKDYMVINDLDLPALLVGWVTAPKLNTFEGGIVDSASGYTIPDYNVFDIRSAEDFNLGHIKEAVNVALADVVTMAADYNDKPIIVVCYSGQTAGRAVMALRLSGYDATVMKFGMSYWHTDFDGWTAKIGDMAVGNGNWVEDASAALPSYEYPTWESDNTDGATILAEKVTAMLAMGWTTSSSDVLTTPADYSIYNFWSEEDYLGFGHFTGAYQIKPISIDGDIIQSFPNDEEFQVYCFTGQTSSYTTAWLQVLGYSAKSITYGVNGLSHTALDDAGKPAWHHSFDYEYVQTK